MEVTPGKLDALIQSGQYRPILEAIKAFRNGFVYGVKVRAPHTLVMSLVWSKSSSLTQVLEKVIKASKQHGLNLGLTAMTFKIVTSLLKYLVAQLSSSGGAPISSATSMLIHFFSGLVAGGLFWGEQNPINTQVCMYLLSRVISGLMWTLIGKYNVKLPPAAFRTFAAVMWGLVLVLYMHSPEALQPSLQMSMGYIYKESEAFTGVYDLVVVNSKDTF